MFSLIIYSTSTQAKLTEPEVKFVQTITKDFIDTACEHGYAIM
jgi:hypothetical protein